MYGSVSCKLNIWEVQSFFLRICDKIERKGFQDNEIERERFPNISREIKIFFICYKLKVSVLVGS